MSCIFCSEGILQSLLRLQSWRCVSLSKGLSLEDLGTLSPMWTLQMQVRLRPKVSEKHSWLYDTLHKAEKLSVHL